MSCFDELAEELNLYPFLCFRLLQQQKMIKAVRSATIGSTTGRAIHRLSCSIPPLDPIAADEPFGTERPSVEFPAFADVLVEG